MNIKCLGYKKDFYGDYMWYYKLIVDNLEYLIINTSSFGILDMVWKNNDFKDADFSDDFKNEILKEIETIQKIDNRIQDNQNLDGEKIYFTPQELPKEKVIRHKGKKYSDDDITTIFEVLDEFDFIHDENSYKIITQEMSDYADKNCEKKDILKRLVGYKVKFETDGDHKNDGQLVGYTFKFKSPSGVKSTIYTEMCLMVGWNHCEQETIN